MVKYNSTQLNSIFSALSDETRRGIVASLTKESLSAQQLAAPYSMSLPAISKHLKVLEKANLVEREIKGRQHIFSLNVKTMASASEWLEQHQKFWHQSLAKLDSYLIKKMR
jgi:DNA-binding transcriptional ArsR family regulator